MLGFIVFVLRLLRARARLDVVLLSIDNSSMEISGRVQNGVVVLDGPMSLPEGVAVTVVVRSSPRIHVSKNPKRVEFPLVRSSAPGSVHLTNERIGELQDEEDIDLMNRG